MNAAEILTLVRGMVPWVVDPSIELWRDGRSGWFRHGPQGGRRVIAFDNRSMVEEWAGWPALPLTDVDVAREIAHEILRSRG